MIESPVIYVIIPAYNEEAVIGQVIDEVNAAGFEHIIVVNDCSSDATASAAQAKQCEVVSHRLNRGKGAAVKTGIEFAKSHYADIVVTIDGDLQHRAADIESVIYPIVYDDFDVVLGTRLLSRQEMPWYKRVQNALADIITFLAAGIYVTDSQSGFRAYGGRALALIDTKTDKYEYESEVIREIARHKLKYTQVGIETRYSTYSLSKPHKQSFTNGLATVARLVWHIFG